MSLPVWCAELAASFWARAGSPPPYPRDLRRPASALPLSVVDLDGVTIGSVRRWFDRDRIEITIRIDEPDRPLRACLVAIRGEGFAFLDSRDSPAERRFSLAHELGHFLRDYLRPRESATARLGRSILEVLDGLRPPTSAERVDAVVRAFAVGPFAHLLRRDDSGRPLSPLEREAEAGADRLAFELLAPADAVGDAADRDALVERLIHSFGLPPEPAAHYAEILRPTAPPIDRSLARLIAV